MSNTAEGASGPGRPGAGPLAHEDTGPKNQTMALALVGDGPSTADIGARIHAEHLVIEAELVEIEMLAQQARTEATRHEAKRATAADRLTALATASGSDPKEIAELSRQLVTLTRRASVMQSQVDVLEGKLKVLARYRDSVATIAADLDRSSAEPGGLPRGRTRLGGARGAGGRSGGARGAEGDDEGDDVMPTAVSRIILGAQEDLRREIARTMHDGPAQSLTNIVLQAQIVERLVARDPASAHAEVRQLISMVQQTLDATKSFIFDVRPMVLDDLGLVPTIRRTARERGRRAQIPVAFESFGSDRRLSMELESGLFRIIDEALSAFLASRPERVAIRLDWSEGLEARVAVERAAAPGGAVSPSMAVAAETARADAAFKSRGRNRGPRPEPEAMPAALAAMIEDRQAAASAAKRAVGGLPAATRREIAQRAATLGIAMVLLQDDQELVLTVESLPPTD